MMTALIVIILIAITIRTVINGVFQIVLVVLKGLWRVIFFLATLPIKILAFLKAFFGSKKN